MQSEVLPSELQYVAPPTIPQARSYMFKQQSDLIEYNISRGERIRINIPRLQRSYLMKDSYLRFRVNMDVTTSTTAALWLDRCGAFGLFDRIEVYDYLGGTLLEQTNNLPALMTLLGDLNYNFMDFNGKLTVTQGYDGSNVGVNGSDVDQLEIRAPNNGFVLIPKAASAQNVFLTYEFTIPIPSFLGLFSDKYAPLHNGFSIDFFVNDFNNAFVSRATALDDTAGRAQVTVKQAWLSNVEWCCQVMELGEIAESMVTATNPFVIHTTQWRNFRDIVLGGGAQSNFRLDLNLNVVSLRNIRFMMRPTAYANNLSYPTYGHRIRNFMNNWNLQYGSSYLPEIAGITTRATTVPTTKNGYTRFLDNGTNLATSSDPYKASGNNQAFMELAKTVPPGKQIPINWWEYRIDTALFPTSTPELLYSAPLTGATNTSVPLPIPLSPNSVSGKFAAGLDTRLSQKNTVSGIDTNGLLVSINATFDRDQITNMVQAALDCWAEHDAFIQIIPGVASTVTF
jgi:hypothetical protein